MIIFHFFVVDVFVDFVLFSRLSVRENLDVCFYMVVDFVVVVFILFSWLSVHVKLGIYLGKNFKKWKMKKIVFLR